MKPFLRDLLYPLPLASVKGEGNLIGLVFVFNFSVICSFLLDSLLLQPYSLIDLKKSIPLSVIVVLLFMFLGNFVYSRKARFFILKTGWKEDSFLDSIKFSSLVLLLLVALTVLLSTVIKY